MIEVDNIVKTYGERIAVDHLSFKLEKGKIYGFLGPNGAGKTTTMNIMTGYIAANEGTVKINDFDILKQPEEAKESIGYLPEIPPLYTEMTVMEYLKFVAELKKVPKKDRRDQIARILKLTMLGDYGDRMIHNLSKGYRQRVGLAQALIGMPEVIILDEPTVGLDPQQIIEIRNLIKSLKDNHIVVLSSHILSEVNEVCDEVMIISHGKLVASGTPLELEKQFSGNAIVKLNIIGSEGVIKGALVGVNNIKNISISSLGDDGSAKVTVETNTKDDIRTDIAKALAVAGLPVLSMDIEKKTLEDVFLTVTQETPGAPAKRKKKEKKMEVKTDDFGKENNAENSESNESSDEPKEDEK